MCIRDSTKKEVLDHKKWKKLAESLDNQTPKTARSPYLSFLSPRTMASVEAVTTRAFSPRDPEISHLHAEENKKRRDTEVSEYFKHRNTERRRKFEQNLSLEMELNRAKREGFARRLEIKKERANEVVNLIRQEAKRGLEENQKFEDQKAEHSKGMRKMIRENMNLQEALYDIHLLVLERRQQEVEDRKKLFHGAYRMYPKKF
eukprot:TRINITY_DN16307_c0_g1_i2.p1 TRINITY_DN16307_c0_g1~~TRINITY_DN16307_c0_g1_i2.p1  ORF type:complete len:222 (+),score=44.55 TRINITY_DN16307_c0_g1_i2:60-668(+)